MMPFTKSLSNSDLIRLLRQHFNLSQGKSAAQLGASFKTVNCWEKGHNVPSPMVFKLIEDLLKSLGESVTDLLQQYFPEAKRDV